MSGESQDGPAVTRGVPPLLRLRSRALRQASPLPASAISQPIDPSAKYSEAETLMEKKGACVLLGKFTHGTKKKVSQLQIQAQVLVLR